MKGEKYMKKYTNGLAKGIMILGIISILLFTVIFIFSLLKETEFIEWFYIVYGFSSFIGCMIISEIIQLLEDIKQELKENL